MFYGLIAMICWGASNFFAGRLSKSIGFLPGLVAGTLGVIISLYVFLVISRFPVELPTVKNLLIILCAGFFLFVAGLSFYKGLAIGKISLLTPIAASWPAGIAIILFLTGKSAVSATKLIGLFIVIIGVFLASIKRNNRKLSFSDPGIPYAFVALFGWVGAFYLFGLTTGSNAWVLLNILFLLCSVFFAAIYGLVRKKRLMTKLSRTSLYYLLSCSIPSAVAFYFYTLGIRSSAAGTTAIVTNLNPLVSILIAFYYLHERLELYQMGALICAILGLVVINV